MRSENVSERFGMGNVCISNTISLIHFFFGLIWFAGIKVEIQREYSVASVTKNIKRKSTFCQSQSMSTIAGLMLAKVLTKRRDDFFGENPKQYFDSTLLCHKFS